MNKPAPDIGFMAAASAFTPSRSRGRSLDRADVLEVALAIADEEGLPGLTMRKLAERLRVSLATVYATAGGKEEILAALVDDVLSDLPPGPEGAAGDDLDAIVSLWVGAHERLVAHPAVAQLASAQPLAGRTVFRILEVTLSRLRRIGLDEAAAVHAYTVLRSYLIGFTILRVSREGLHTDDERARLAAVRGLPVEEYPTLRAAAPLLATQMTTDHFVTGFRQMLDGVLRATGE